MREELDRFDPFKWVEVVVECPLVTWDASAGIAGSLLRRWEQRGWAVGVCEAARGDETAPWSSGAAVKPASSNAPSAAAAALP